MHASGESNTGNMAHCVLTKVGGASNGACTVGVANDCSPVGQLGTDVPLLLQSISQLPAICSDQAAVERQFQQYAARLDGYQEQPHLLEPAVPQLLDQLLAHVNGFTAPAALIHTAFKYLAHLIKVRGAKALVRRLPHETDDVLSVLAYLEQQNDSQCCHWETRYVLLLWLSVLVLTPFAMTAFDDGVNTPITTRVLTAVECYLDSVNRCQEASALVLARFVTRPDMASTHLASFVDKLFLRLEASACSLPSRLGSLLCLASVFKHGRRADLQLLATSCLSRLLQLPATHAAQSPHTRVRKLSLKLLQRIGLAFLPAQPASWRYERGQRSLAVNLQSASAGRSGAGGADDGQESDAAVSSTALPADTCRPTGDVSDPGVSSESSAPGEERAAGAAISSVSTNTDAQVCTGSVPEQVEDVIEHVIVALKDPDTIVRWTAAKSVGRVASRLASLDTQLSDDVVECVTQEAFAVPDNTASWHGGCLALAELSRRGVLSLRQLAAAVPVLLRALVYDQVHGSWAVGAAVRDAACYLCWAFARAFAPTALRHHVLQIAPALLCAALFDREVSCRRAAAAAFQENVGRQGTFPHGIDIVTSVDYFAVGNRFSCFSQLSVFVAGFGEYTRPLMCHLVENKVGHWDVVIRQLAAKALHNLCACDPDYAGGYVCDVLRAGCTHPCDLATRHGSLLALGSTLLALSRLPDGTTSATIDDTTIAFVRSIHSVLVQRRAMQGVGCELMYKALCHFISCCCQASLPISDENTLNEWRGVLDVCLCHVDDAVRQSAVDAVPHFARVYCQQQQQLQQQLAAPLLDHYLVSAAAENQPQRRGYCLALGSLPASVVARHFDAVVARLVACCRVTPATHSWAECRRDAALALTRLCTVTGVASHERDGICSSNVSLIYECLLDCLKDHTLDRRGDIGAWVREAGIVGLQRLTILLAAADASAACDGCTVRLLTPPLVTRVLVAVVQLTAEKIDRTRSVAGAALCALLAAVPHVPHVPERAALSRIVGVSAAPPLSVAHAPAPAAAAADGDDGRDDGDVSDNDSQGADATDAKLHTAHTTTSPGVVCCECDVLSDDEARECADGEARECAAADGGEARECAAGGEARECAAGGEARECVDWSRERTGLQCAGRLLALSVYHDAVLFSLLLAAGSVGERLTSAASSVLCQHLAPPSTTAAAAATAVTVPPPSAVTSSPATPTVAPASTAAAAAVAGEDNCGAVVAWVPPAERCARFVAVFVGAWSDHLRQSRVSVALMRALPPILAAGVLASVSADAALGVRLLALCRGEMARSADVQKLLAGVELLCALLEFWWPSAEAAAATTPLSPLFAAAAAAAGGGGSSAPAPETAASSAEASVFGVCRSTLHTLTQLLCHRYPRVRRGTAQSLYEALLTVVDVDDDCSGAAEDNGRGDGGGAMMQQLLADTEWGDELDVVRPVRDKIRQQLQLPPLTIGSAAAVKAAAAAGKTDLNSATAKTPATS